MDVVIAERVPLRAATLNEIRRVARSGAFIVLRHAPVTWFDPHRLVHVLLPGKTNRMLAKIGGQTLQETIIEFDETAQAAYDQLHLDLPIP